MDKHTQLNQVIDVLMLAGAILSQSGAEIHRVEDTMIRIAHSQGIENANVLAIPAAIFFSIDHTNISRMKRIVHQSYDMQKVCQVNQVSRSLVEGQLSLEEALAQLNQIKNQPQPYSNLQVTLAAVVAAPFFTIMFGGGPLEALVTALATLLAFPFSLLTKQLIGIDFVSTFAGALVFSLVAYLVDKNGSLLINPNLVNAGAVMPFVPGIAFTNAVRDLMTNHINTGMTKIFQTLLVILSLGAGTAVAFLIVG
ncbi:threonine/serine exporter family protein [Streptococcus suis]|uniref:threonine/serine exporter family protein n=1 Tax=Streptococcus suis TaxID=1307 RepID=UPI001ABE5B0D|nr:threonine/serine exporter family protein [Streptococcus suis]